MRGLVRTSAGCRYLLATGEYQQRAARLGARLDDGLRALIGRGVLAVRTRGLWAGVDVDPALMTGRELCEKLAARGVLAKETHGSTVRLAPPIIIDEEDLDRLLDAITAVVTGG
ncbi:MAG TPA: aminotransferase class III-fold pyridoxal phosphate-dependent enzyme [Flexivirga sp.]|uniref:aminotransferase class III-fold pyridoxal phosphate-dependent enzyme n=1 Tax=Flexivirga sp. TaxID=1962927 RepID=UPI002BECF1FA|nr:aminotransferase class III-fold pyridoxal phosphate-dependent enzyme [Flexivirga sp.]HWC22828.1 aminotransferase class III-fold pyridoxal phosphate-dependent enzyme [Flexivirga sp.]